MLVAVTPKELSGTRGGDCQHLTPFAGHRAEGGTALAPGSWALQTSGMPPCQAGQWHAKAGTGFATGLLICKTLSAIGKNNSTALFQSEGTFLFQKNKRHGL